MRYSPVCWALCCCLLLALAAPLTAQVAIGTDSELVGISDLIVVATVTKVFEEPDVMYGDKGTAVLSVERVLKGPQVATVTVHYPLPPKALPDGMFGGVSMARIITLAPQQQQLFFLQRTQRDYMLVNMWRGDINASLAEVKDADRYAELVKNAPATVTLVAPLGPCYFAKTTTINVKLKNTGKQPLQYHNPLLEGFFVTSRMGPTLPLTIVPDKDSPVRPILRNVMPVNDSVEFDPLAGLDIAQFEAVPGGIAPGPGAEAPKLPTLAPGAETTLALKVTCTQPDSWKLFTPDTCFLSPALIRVRIPFQLTTEVANGGRAFQQMITIASPWSPLLVGFAPPAEIEEMLAHPDKL